MLQSYPNYGKGHPKFDNCDSWWKELIIRLFQLDRHDDQALALCHRLIHHFTSEEAYSVYDDVVPTLQALQKQGVKLIVASNSDPRALTILESLKIKQYFIVVSISIVVGFLSYDSDYSKPTKAFLMKLL